MANALSGGSTTRRLKIAVSTVVPGPHVLVWSGTPAHFVDALRRRDDVEVVVLEAPSAVLHRILNAFAGVTGRMGRRVNWEVEPLVLRAFTWLVRRQWRRQEPDVVIAMGWMPRGLEPSDPPVLFWGDATIMQRIDRAPHWSRLSARTRSLVGPAEREAVDELDGVILPSRWAIDGFVGAHGAAEAKFSRIAFGANIADPGPVERRPPTPGSATLLTVGVDWSRKGVDLAVETADALRSRGVDARLHVVGAMPPSDQWHRSYVTYHGFLSKQSGRDGEKLADLYRSADVFLLPSRNDPSPMVLGEAGSFCLPIVASDVDGIPERVERGGVLLPATSTAHDYAQAIVAVLEPARYVGLSQGSRRDFEARSSWDAAAERVVRLCESRVMAGRDHTIGVAG